MKNSIDLLQFAWKSTGWKAVTIHCWRISWGCWKEANFQVGGLKWKLVVRYCLVKFHIDKCLYYCSVTGFLLLLVRFLPVKLISYSKPSWRMRKWETRLLKLFTWCIFNEVFISDHIASLQLMNLLFSFLNPKPSHSNLLAGYFSKVPIFWFWGLKFS